MASAENRGSPLLSICDGYLFQKHFKYVFTKSDITNKMVVSTCDFNVNLLDFNISKKMQSFVDV